MSFVPRERGRRRVLTYISILPSQRAGDRPPLVWFLDILKVLSDSGDVNGVQLVITQSEIGESPTCPLLPRIQSARSDASLVL